MQSILFLVYILIPLTIGVRNYQNSMIGMFNSGVPKVPNSHNIYDLYNKGMKKTRQEIYPKMGEDETPPEPEQTNIYNQDDLANSDQIELSANIDLRRRNSASTGPPKLSLDFPIPGSHVGEYNPYPTILRQWEDGVNIDQYYPVPPHPQGRVDDVFALEREEKDMFLPRIGENDGPVVQSKEYSSPLIGRAIGQKYKGEIGRNNGFYGVNNGHNRQINDYNKDMYVDIKAIKDFIPPEKLVGTTFEQVSNQQALLETYKKIKDVLNAKLIGKDSLGYNRGSNGLKGVSNSFNGGLKGLERGSNGSNGGRNGFNGGSNGFNGGSNGFNGGSNGFNGGSNGLNTGLYVIERGSSGSNGGLKGLERGSNGSNGGRNGFNGGSNGFNGGSNGFNGGSNGLNTGLYVIERGSSGSNGGLKGLERGSNGSNGGRNGFNAASNGFNTGLYVIERGSSGSIGGLKGLERGSNGFNGGRNGFNGGSNGFNGGRNGFNGGSNGFNGGRNGFNGGLNVLKGSNGAKRPVRQGYDIQFTGMKTSNKGHNGDKIVYYNDIPAYIKRGKALSDPEKSWKNDVFLMAESLEELNWMLDGLASASRRIGLGMNLDKTKVMINGHIDPRPVVELAELAKKNLYFLLF